MSNQYTNPWTENDFKILKSNYKIMSAKKLATILNKTTNSIFVMGYRLKLKKETSNISSTYFLDIINPETSYILGYLWADGSIRNKSKNIKLKIKKDDYDNIRSTLNFIGIWSEYLYISKNPKHSDKIEGRFNNKIVYNFLLMHDYYHKSTASPTKILNTIPKHLHQYFFRGYFDGDGCIQKYTTCITGDYNQNWHDIINLCKQLEINFTIVKQINKKRNSKCSRIHIYGKSNIKKFLSYIYTGRGVDNIGLNRKYRKYTEFFS